VANIGRRPTVHATPESLLEVNLFDFTGTLYGEELEVTLFAFLRPERRFAGIDALRAQIAADAAEAAASLTSPCPLRIVGRCTDETGANYRPDRSLAAGFIVI